MHVCWAGQYPVAMQPSAKGFFPENHKRFLGTYWGQVSSPYCSEVVESCDVYMFVGAIHNDYSSVGYSLLLKKEKMIDVSLSTLLVCIICPACACVRVHAGPCNCADKATYHCLGGQMRLFSFSVQLNRQSGIFCMS